MVRSARLFLISRPCRRVILVYAGDHGDSDNYSRLIQCWNCGVDDMRKYCFDATISDCPENGLNHLQWLIMPNNLIFMGLHFVIGKCT